MKTLKIFALSAIVIISSCAKDTLISSEELSHRQGDSLLSVFQKSKVSPSPIVNLSTKSTASTGKGTASASATVIRDSIWPGGSGKSLFVESQDIFVSNENYDYAYPGAIFKSRPIVQDYSFKPLDGRLDYDPLPIRISLSIPGANVSGTVEYPSLNETRDLVGQIIARAGNVNQINSFSYASSEFTDYNELKYTFGANVNVGAIANITVTGNGTKISKKTGIIAKFTQENFTVDMSLPRRTELISVADANALNPEYSPVYVSSVTYGRFGMFIAESDASYQEFDAAFKAGINIGIVKGDAHVTTEQKSLLDKAKITLYMKFGPGTAYVKTVQGYDEFKNAIIAGGSITADSYGGPISIRMRNLKDFSLFKTIFKIDLKN